LLGSLVSGLATPAPEPDPFGSRSVTMMPSLLQLEIDTAKPAGIDEVTL
jgi:hypothetical protein